MGPQFIGRKKNIIQSIETLALNLHGTHLYLVLASLAHSKYIAPLGPVLIEQINQRCNNKIAYKHYYKKPGRR